MSSRNIIACTFSTLLLGLTACNHTQPVPIPAPEAVDKNRPLAPGQLALRKITDPALIPAFANAFYSAKDGQLEQSIRNSLHYLNKPSSKKFFPYGEVTHEQAIASLNAFLDVVRDASSP